MLIDIRTTVATKPLSTVHELSTFSSFRKSISILVADLTETSSRLIIIPKRNKIEKDLYRTVVSPPKIARTMPIVSCYACSAVWYTPEFLLRRIFPMSRFLPCLAGSRDRIFVGPVGTILYSTVLYYSLGELLDENPRGVICPGGEYPELGTPWGAYYNPGLLFVQSGGGSILSCAPPGGGYLA